MLRTAIEFVRYGITGVLALVVYLVLSNVLYCFSAPIWLATAVAWCLSAATSYLGHIYFTYRVEADHKRMPVRFAIMLGFHLGLTFLITYVCLNVFGLPYLPTTVVTVCITPLATFPIGKYWVFKTSAES
ncbi:MAG: GtrA family protein [Pseudodesulfovibrio sp.]